MTLEYDLTIKAAWLSNIEEKTLVDIANLLDISIVKTHRLITTAEKTGLLKTWVDAYPEDCIEKASQIKELFSLSSCHVVPDKELKDPEQSIKITGYAVAQKIYSWLQHQRSGFIGIGKGRTLKAMARALPNITRPKLNFIAVSGSMKYNYAIMKEDVIHDLTIKTQGKGFLLPHPYFAKDINKKKAFLTQQTIKELHKKAINADKIIVGVGNTIGSSIFNQNHLIGDELWTQVIEQGAVSDFLGTLLDINGNPVSAANNLSLGLKIEDIRNQTVLAAVGGKNKGEATLAALRTGVITDLIIGETSAERVLLG